MHVPRHAVGWLFASAAVASVGTLASCGGSDYDPPAPTPAPAPPTGGASASAMMTTLTTDVTRSMTRLGMLETGALNAMNPGFPLSPNMTGAPDNSAGTPPNTFTFGGTLDGNGNGQDETTLNGRVTFVNNPTDFVAGFNGAQGTAAVAIDILGLLHVYRGNVAFALGMTENQLSGSGTFTNPMTGTTSTMTIAPADPLKMKPADGSATAKPNACAHSFNGPLDVAIGGAAGTLAAQWRFAYNSTMVAVTGATFTNTSGQSTALADTSIDLGCAGNNSINDWNGRFKIRWVCLPRESGEFNTTIAVKNATTLTMIDDGDTAADAYEASVIGSSARAIRGFFIDGQAGSRYREDFNWTLSIDGSGFSQTSRYVYFEGALSGRGGLCMARATRIA